MSEYNLFRIRGSTIFTLYFAYCFLFCLILFVVCLHKMDQVEMQTDVGVEIWFKSLFFNNIKLIGMTVFFHATRKLKFIESSLGFKKSCSKFVDQRTVKNHTQKAQNSISKKISPNIVEDRRMSRLKYNYKTEIKICNLILLKLHGQKVVFLKCIKFLVEVINYLACIFELTM